MDQDAPVTRGDDAQAFDDCSVMSWLVISLFIQRMLSPLFTRISAGTNFICLISMRWTKGACKSFADAFVSTAEIFFSPAFLSLLHEAQAITKKIRIIERLNSFMTYLYIFWTICACSRWVLSAGTTFCRSALSSAFSDSGIRSPSTAPITAWWYATSLSM